MKGKKETGKSFAGFGIIISFGNNGELKILVVMEDPKKKKGGSRWENFFLKFPGGTIEPKKNGDSVRLSGFKVLSEVCGISFERLGEEPFFSVEEKGHLARFYLAKLDEGDPRPCKSLRFAEMAPERSLRLLWEKKKFLKKHGLAMGELFRCLDLIRSGNKVPEHALPLKKYCKEAIK